MQALCYCFRNCSNVAWHFSFPATGCCPINVQLFIGVEVISDNAQPPNYLSFSLCSVWSISLFLSYRKGKHSWALYNYYISLWFWIFFKFFFYFVLQFVWLCSNRLSNISLGLADFVNPFLDTAQFQIKNRFHLLIVTVPSQRMLATTLRSPRACVLLFRINYKL